jgi:hypothetical protein
MHLFARPVISFKTTLNTAGPSSDMLANLLQFNGANAVQIFFRPTKSDERMKMHNFRHPL